MCFHGLFAKWAFLLVLAYGGLNASFAKEVETVLDYGGVIHRTHAYRAHECIHDGLNIWYQPVRQIKRYISWFFPDLGQYVVM